MIASPALTAARDKAPAGRAATVEFWCIGDYADAYLDVRYVVPGERDGPKTLAEVLAEAEDAIAPPHGLEREKK
jgi:hypothetical protein